MLLEQKIVYYRLTQTQMPGTPRLLKTHTAKSINCMQEAAMSSGITKKEWV